MTWYDNKQNGAVCQWKTIIEQFQNQQNKVNFNIDILKKKDFKNIALLNAQNLLMNASVLLNQIKTCNTEVIQFIKRNILALIYASIKFVLQIPAQTESQARKYKFPLLAIQFLEGLITLPNIMLINLMNQEVYETYCQCIFYFFEQNNLTSKLNIEYYENSLYFNYFQRLFKIPNVYSGIQQSKYGAYSNITASVLNSTVQKKQSFFQALIETIQLNCKYGQILIQNIRCESILSCIKIFVIMNGMHNCPLKVKLFIIKKGLQSLHFYNQNIKSVLKREIIRFNDIKREETVENILRLFIQIVQACQNIYDGKKLYEAICTKDMFKLCIQLISANFIYLQNFSKNQSSQKNSQQNIAEQLVPFSIQQKITGLLQVILRQDLQFIKCARQSVFPSIIQQSQSNQIFLMIHSLKIIYQKNRKIKIKDINLVKMFNLMLSNPFKYDIIDKIKKYSFFKILLQLFFKNNQNDIFLNQVNKVFLKIFKGQISLVSILSNNKGFDNAKIERQTFQEKLYSLSFQSMELVQKKVLQIKSHKDPLFGQIFKLSRCIKQYCRNYLKFTDPQLITNSSISQSTNSSISVSFNLQDLQLIHKNQFIRTKCKQWYLFYQNTFAQLQANYNKQLGKFDQFNQLPPQQQTLFTVRKYCQVNSVSQSQFLHNKQEIQASIKNSMEILSLKKLQQEIQQPLIENQNFSLDFKKKNKTEPSIESNFLIKNQIQSLHEPIKIEFIKVNSDIASSQSQNDQEMSIGSQKSDEPEETFQKYMQKKISQINQTKQLNSRKKSKTPTKFKSSQSKTPPKQKRWGTSNTKTQNAEIKKEKQEKQQNSSLNKDFPIQRRARSQQKQKLQILKQRLKKNMHQFSNLKFIKVGSKRPKIYKQREINKIKDSKILSLLRG